MFVFNGYLTKSGSMWEIGLNDLAIFTQGKTKDDALFMLQEAINELADLAGVSKKQAKATIAATAKGTVEVSFDNLPAIFAFVLDRIKVARGMSIADLCRAVSKNSRTTIARYLSGASVPTVPALALVLAALGYRLRVERTIS